MGFLSIFSFLSSFNFSKLFNIKTLLIVAVLSVITYDTFRISSLKKDVNILNLRIEKVKIDRDNCKDANANNIKELSIIKSRYSEVESIYKKQIDSRDEIISSLRKDIHLLKKKLDTKPSKIIKIKDCKIPIIEGKDIKDEEFKNLYDSVSTIGK